MNNFDFFEKYCKERVVSSFLAKEVLFSVSDESGERTAYCTFNASGYYCRIYLTEDGCISSELSWDNEDFSWDITDVFDELDIEDYNGYDYSDCFGENSIKNAVDKTISMLLRYSYDIAKAGEEAHQEGLFNNRNELESEKNNHPKLKDYRKYQKLHDKMVKTRSDSDRERFAALLEEWQQRGWLLKRDEKYLQRLKSGIIDEEYNPSGDYQKKFTICHMFSYAIISALSFAFCFGLFGLSTYIYLRGGIIIIPKESYLFTAIAGVILSVFLCHLFGIKLTQKIAPKSISDYKEEYAVIAKKKLFVSKTEKVIIMIIMWIAFILGFPLMMLSATNNLSFYEDHYDVHYLLFNESVKYSDCTVYLVKGYTDHDEFIEYQNPYYRFVYTEDGEEFTDETLEIESREKQEKLKEIFEKNNITINEIKE